MVEWWNIAFAFAGDQPYIRCVVFRPAYFSPDRQAERICDERRLFVLGAAHQPGRGRRRGGAAGVTGAHALVAGFRERFLDQRLDKEPATIVARPFLRPDDFLEILHPFPADGQRLAGGGIALLDWDTCCFGWPIGRAWRRESVGKYVYV